MQRSTERILTTHVGSLIRPPQLLEFLRAKQKGEPFDQHAYEACLTDSVAEVVRRQAQAGHRRDQRRRVRQIDQLVAIRARAPERLRAPAGEARRQPVRARRRSRALRRVLRRARRARGRRRPRATRSASGRSPIPGRRSSQRDIDNFKAALKNVKVEEAFLPVAAPASVIPDRKNEYYKSDEECLHAIGDGDAHRVQDDRRCRLPAAARRCARGGDLRPHGAAGELRRLPQMGRDAHGGAQPRDRGAAARAHPLSRLLGQLARTAHHRRAAQGHRRSHPVGARRRLCDRGRQSAPRARVEGLAGREAAGGQGADPGRHQPRHQRGGASRAGRRAHRAATPSSSGART